MAVSSLRPHGDASANAERVQLTAERALDAAERVVMRRGGALLGRKHLVSDPTAEFTPSALHDATGFACSAKGVPELLKHEARALSVQLSVLGRRVDQSEAGVLNLSGSMSNPIQLQVRAVPPSVPVAPRKAPPCVLTQLSLVRGCPCTLPGLECGKSVHSDSSWVFVPSRHHHFFLSWRRRRHRAFDSIRKLSGQSRASVEKRHLAPVG